jgi:hypothetical protein
VRCLIVALMRMAEWPTTLRGEVVEGISTRPFAYMHIKESRETIIFYRSCVDSESGQGAPQNSRSFPILSLFFEGGQRPAGSRLNWVAFCLRD